MGWVIFITVLVILGFLCVICAFFTGVEYHDCIPVKKLMVVQHFGAEEFVQIVDLSLLDEHGFAKLDQYFADVPFEEEDMLDAGFKRSQEEELVYWKIVKDTELIQVLSPKSHYWIWGRDDYE